MAEEKSKIGSVIATIVLAVVCAAGGWIGGGIFAGYKMTKMAQAMAAQAAMAGGAAQTVAVAVWDGLVQSKIERFLECNLAETLRNTYEAMWNSIRIGVGVDGRCTKEF